MTFSSISIACSAVFDQFELVSLDSLKETFVKMKPSSCGMDVVPFRLLKDSFDTIGPKILAIINSSLATGVVPKSFKHAAVEPVIKKSNLDHSVFAHYRPLSKLPFLSKLLEKVVFRQLNSFLDLHGIHEVFQSGFKVFNDLLLVTDSGDWLS